MNNLIVSLDGPSGSGKEKIAKYISKKYNLYHVDSGTLYRRLAAFFLKNKIDIKSKKKIILYLKSINYLSHRKHHSLRKEDIGTKSSEIATIPIVREFINVRQKKIVSDISKKYNGCIIDGRDIGSKVFKNAQIKLFINVKLEIRAKRRHKQLILLGEKSIYSRILKDLKLRDRTDKKRKASPLTVPLGAIIINNSNSFSETVDQIKKIFDNFNKN